jgi:hypothetical protein
MLWATEGICMARTARSLVWATAARLAGKARALAATVPGGATNEGSTSTMDRRRNDGRRREECGTPAAQAARGADCGRLGRDLPLQGARGSGGAEAGPAEGPGRRGPHAGNARRGSAWGPGRARRARGGGGRCRLPGGSGPWLPGVAGLFRAAAPPRSCSASAFTSRGRLLRRERLPLWPRAWSCPSELSPRFGDPGGGERRAHRPSSHEVLISVG